MTVPSSVSVKPIKQIIKENKDIKEKNWENISLISTIMFRKLKLRPKKWFSYKKTSNGKIKGSIFLELSQAFDTINHGLLIARLEGYGFFDAPLME